MPGPQPPKWTYELIEAELALLCAHTSVWLTKAEFLDAGLSGLLETVQREHGSAWWARRLELPPTPTPTPGGGEHDLSATAQPDRATTGPRHAS